jgi:hypothetical protein
MNYSPFLNQNNVCSDKCWRQSKDINNTQIDNYYHYNTNFDKCVTNKVQMPSTYLDHINLRGRPGYGLAEECSINTDSEFRNDPSRLTQDRCNIQLSHRLFQGAPNLRPGGDINTELDILTGSDSDQVLRNSGCKKNIHEKAMYIPPPLLPCISTISKVENTVEGDWNRRGGVDTKSYINRKKFLEQCGTDNIIRNGSWIS